MAWSHPDISLDELITLIKGLIDILILASGYQSSGLPATWDADNIKKAIQWGIFFEEVLNHLHGTPYFEESIKELDEALLNLTSNPLFPQGLARLTSATLSSARYLVLQHLLKIHPPEDAHIFGLLTAVIEVDISELSDVDGNGPHIYIDRLTSKIESLTLESANNLVKDSTVPLYATGSRTSACSKYKVLDQKMPTDKYVCNSHFVIRELLKRRASKSCLFSVETGLYKVSEVVTRSNSVELENTLSEGPVEEEIMNEKCFWNNWRSRCLSYLLDKRTVKLISGANLIFTAPKLQWIHVFEALKFATDAENDNLLEIMEILLLGFISSRWSCLLEHFISRSYDFLPISKQYSDLQNLLQGDSQSLRSKSQVLNSKEKDIIEYLMLLLKSQPHKLWEVPAVLVAAAIPSGSILFKIYFNDIEKQFTEASSSTRCCGCHQVGKKHRDCEVADRIRCLHMFHVQGPSLMVDDSSV
ncbi:uncharacterized protein A4U43_C01F7640 [Asparagus officinalis]|uniref:Uncharacterized protein n=1 Tax=Asparagus officinalis TaxID=4686 RepID=A0A5P1FN69_ASPOF|nr:uncharacterized protein LOC109851073 [Asparagus officinalis]XP_020276777.1 uncharacterized protein LOC109851073 [Asparagus officinalis]ONK79562.1 uncharacterized protein A4U43_C01F7640 [Asparagus officinalis]